MMRFYIAILFLSLLSCKEEKSLKTIDIVSKKGNNFFETIDKVRLISYSSRTQWNPNEPFDYYSKKEIVIPEDKIVDDVILSEKDKNSIISILKKDYKEKCTNAACYEPRHMLQFYKKNKLVAYVEFCSECGGSRESKNLKFLPSFCIEKGQELNNIFIKLGLKITSEFNN
ncbi:hypothetical protein G6N05_14545 [Flavobacterium sp. F372]|uniref:Lipoprotein n=2 Tax=Flavobacterium bernardetii TaxID=2813823 RepID=A0ABR7J2G9_9FLAO|nr:hypothetical protein [Flavobacterium bernardetii]MBC5836146.1 hypothetical protein [Flavobacterium bernardetii]NHF71331.1 hypothetical protein [Flavobacterium bernardetii]